MSGATAYPTATRIANFEIGMAREYLKLGAPERAAPHIWRTMSKLRYRPAEVTVPPGMTPLAAITEAAKMIGATHSTIEKMGHQITLAPSEIARLGMLLNVGLQACKPAETPLPAAM